MEHKYLGKQYLTETLNNFVTALKENLTGQVTDLQTTYTLDAEGNAVNEDGERVTLTDAINEVLGYVTERGEIANKTYAEWSANAVRYEEVDVNAKVFFRAYRITNGFTYTDGKYYQAGSIIFATGHEHITSPVDREVYTWQILPSEAGLIGNFADLDARIPTGTATDAVKTMVDVSNHILKDMEVTMVESNEDSSVLKKYTIYQGIATDTRVKIGEVNIPLDLVVSSASVITADGTEVVGKGADGFDITLADQSNDNVGKRFVKFVIKNQPYPLYIKVEDFIKLYEAELSAAQVQLEIDGENVIRATIVEDSIGHTELDKKTEKELNFTGYNHTYDDDTDVEYGTPQLTTTATNLRTAVNELDNENGDLTTLNAKLRTQDVADDGIPTLVKASNLAYTRSIVTVDDTITNTTDTKAEYKFTQDGQTLCTIVVPKDIYVNKGEVITADGSEIVGHDDATNADIMSEVGRKYLKLYFKNSDNSLYVDFDSLFNKAQLNATQVQIVIDDTQTISASIVAGSVTPTELNELLNKKINFTGYNAAFDETVPVSAQLTTTAQTLREAVNEHDAEIGDASTLETIDKTNLVKAINELNSGKLNIVTGVDPDDFLWLGLLQEPYKSMGMLLYVVPPTKEINLNNKGTIKGGGIVLFGGQPTWPESEPIWVLYDGNQVGDLSTLTTTEKATAVKAINELVAKLGDLTTLETTDKTTTVAAINEVNGVATKALHLIAFATPQEFDDNYKAKADLKQFDAVVITEDFKCDGVYYKAGTWAYKAISIQNGAVRTEWSFMNNGGGGDAIYQLGTTTTPPNITTVAQMENILVDRLYIFADDDGNKSSYIYVKNSATDPSQNYWMQISSDMKGIEWIGSYNYIATVTVTDPDTGEATQVVTPWEASAAQLAALDAWVYNTYGRTPVNNDLITLTIDTAYYGQYLYKNNTWSEYSSLTKASKAQYGVTKFATQNDYDAGDLVLKADGSYDASALTKNVAVDPWLLRQILSHVATDDNIYTKAQTDLLLNAKVDTTTLAGYYDGTTVDNKLKALQKAYVVDTNPEDMDDETLETYYGSLIYYVDPDDGSTSTYICDSTGVLQNLGTSGVSLTGYVEVTDSKYRTLSDIKTTDADGAALTVQKQIDGKQDKIESGALTTVLSKDLSANRVIITNTNGKLAQSVITSSELAMLDDINTAGDTIEMRLQNLEAGGGGGTGTGDSSIKFVTELPTADIEVKTIYRRTTDNTYWIYDNANWHRLDNSAEDHKINNNVVDGSSTSESLGIVRSLTSAQYNALSNAEKMNGTIYCITDDATAITSLVSQNSVAGVSSVNGKTGDITLPTLTLGGRSIALTPNAAQGVEVVNSINNTSGVLFLKNLNVGGTEYSLLGSGTIDIAAGGGSGAVSSVDGKTGAVSLKKISINGGTAQSLSGSGTINITSGGGGDAADIAYTTPTNNVTTATNLQDVIDALQSEIKTLKAKVATLEANMPTYTLSGTTLTITTP